MICSDRTDVDLFVNIGNREVDFLYIILFFARINLSNVRLGINDILSLSMPD